MLFSDRSRSHYRNAPVHEVICQLRFPTILTINSVEPADFQEAIRAEFPQYARRQDAAPPRITGLGSPNPKVEQQPPITNYNFLSADGVWKLNLTENFIALSTLRYPGWEEFARQLDKPLASFIRIYHPSFFQRVGLRYVNIVSRSRLGLGRPVCPRLHRGAAGGGRSRRRLHPLLLRSAGKAGLQLSGQDPRRSRPHQEQRPRRHSGPGGQVHL